jgi:hypothetical protein
MGRLFPSCFADSVHSSAIASLSLSGRRLTTSHSEQSIARKGLDESIAIIFTQEQRHALAMDSTCFLSFIGRRALKYDTRYLNGTNADDQKDK